MASTHCCVHCPCPGANKQHGLGVSPAWHSRSGQHVRPHRPLHLCNSRCRPVPAAARQAQGRCLCRQGRVGDRGKPGAHATTSLVLHYCPVSTPAPVSKFLTPICTVLHLQGLGAIIAQYLARQGAKVIISARSQDKLQVCHAQHTQHMHTLRIQPSSTVCAEISALFS